MASAELNDEPRLFAPAKKRRKTGGAGQRPNGTDATAVRSVASAEHQSTPTPARLASSPSDRQLHAQQAAAEAKPFKALRSTAACEVDAPNALQANGEVAVAGDDYSAAAAADGEAADEPPPPLAVADTTFRALGISEWLDRVCRSLGMTKPTVVQAGCIPAVLAGRNAIGTAHTGSGKTAAFALPILQLLAADPYGIFALVLTPTR